MAIDTPARLAIVGAGPIGLEAALYARFLGYDVVVFERGDIAAHVRQWADQLMEARFGATSTTLGIAAIEAQDESYVPPAADDLLTGEKWLERYLLPLARTDLLVDHLRLHSIVIAVEQQNGSDDELLFRVSSRDAMNQEQTEAFDGVLDCTGSEYAEWSARETACAPHCHVLGEKAHNLGTPFRLVDGHEQIRQVFAILGDRDTLDLYTSAKSLLK